MRRPDGRLAPAFGKALLISALALAASASTGAEADTRSPGDRYEGDAFAAVTLCSLSLKLAMMRAESGGASSDGDQADYRKCIKDQKPVLKASYDGLLRTLRKPAARDALKEHYIATLGALDGIVPLAGEIKIDYQRRQNANTAKAQERWSRFEVER